MAATLENNYVSHISVHQNICIYLVYPPSKTDIINLRMLIYMCDTSVFGSMNRLIQDQSQIPAVESWGKASKELAQHILIYSCNFKSFFFEFLGQRKGISNKLHLWKFKTITKIVNIATMVFSSYFNTLLLACSVYGFNFQTVHGYQYAFTLKIQLTQEWVPQDLVNFLDLVRLLGLFPFRFTLHLGYFLNSNKMQYNQGCVGDLSPMLTHCLAHCKKCQLLFFGCSRNT